jgi:hypothetical protein
MVKLEEYCQRCLHQPVQNLIIEMGIHVLQCPTAQDNHMINKCILCHLRDSCWYLTFGIFNSDCKVMFVLDSLFRIKFWELVGFVDLSSVSALFSWLSLIVIENHKFWFRGNCKLKCFPMNPTNNLRNAFLFSIELVEYYCKSPCPIYASIWMVLEFSCGLLVCFEDSMGGNPRLL